MQSFGSRDEHVSAKPSTCGQQEVPQETEHDQHHQDLNGILTRFDWTMTVVFGRQFVRNHESKEPFADLTGQRLDPLLDPTPAGRVASFGQGVYGGQPHPTAFAATEIRSDLLRQRPSPWVATQFLQQRFDPFSTKLRSTLNRPLRASRFWRLYVDLRRLQVGLVAVLACESTPASTAEPALWLPMLAACTSGNVED